MNKIIAVSKFQLVNMKREDFEYISFYRGEYITYCKTCNEFIEDNTKEVICDITRFIKTADEFSDFLICSSDDDIFAVYEVETYNTEICEDCKLNKEVEELDIEFLRPIYDLYKFNERFEDVVKPYIGDTYYKKGLQQVGYCNGSQAYVNFYNQSRKELERFAVHELRHVWQYKNGLLKENTFKTFNQYLDEQKEQDARYAEECFIKGNYELLTQRSKFL